MNTKILMVSSSVFLGVSGLILTFLPDEIILSLSIASNSTVAMFLQLLGALYIGFAMVKLDG